MKKLLLLPIVFIFFVIPMADTLLFEDFESGEMPPDWQVWDYYPNFYSFYFNETGTGYSGNYAAVRGQGYYEYHHNYGYPGSFTAPDESWLVSPTLDMSNYENLSLSLMYKCKEVGDLGPSVEIFASYTQPSYFYWVQPLGGPPNDYEQRVIDISILDGSPYATFAIKYKAGQSITRPGVWWSDSILIDDILVTGDVRIAPSAFDLLNPVDGAVFPVSQKGNSGNEVRVSRGNSTIIKMQPVSGGKATEEIDFTWEASTTGGTGNITYTWECDDNADFSSPEHTVTGLTSETHTESFAVTEDETWYWRVTAIEDDQNIQTVCTDDFSFDFDWSLNIKTASLGEIKAIYK